MRKAFPPKLRSASLFVVFIVLSIFLGVGINLEERYKITQKAESWDTEKVKPISQETPILKDLDIECLSKTKIKYHSDVIYFCQPDTSIFTYIQMLGTDPSLFKGCSDIFISKTGVVIGLSDSAFPQQTIYQHGELTLLENVKLNSNLVSGKGHQMTRVEPFCDGIVLSKKFKKYIRANTECDSGYLNILIKQIDSI